MGSIDPRGCTVRSRIRRSKEPPRCPVTCIYETNASEPQLPVVCSSFACKLSVGRTDRGSPAISCVLLSHGHATVEIRRHENGRWSRFWDLARICATVSLMRPSTAGNAPCPMPRLRRWFCCLVIWRRREEGRPR